MDLQRWLTNQWDRVIAVVAVLLGAVSLLLGWIGISGSNLPSQQIPYLASGGLVGMFALGIGATAWLSADLRDEWRKLDDIYRRRGENGAQATTVGDDSASDDSQAVTPRNGVARATRKPVTATLDSAPDDRDPAERRARRANSAR